MANTTSPHLLHPHPHPHPHLYSQSGFPEPQPGKRVLAEPEGCECKSTGSISCVGKRKYIYFHLPPRLPLYTSNPFCHTSFRVYSWPAIGSTSILELRTKVAVPSQTHFSLAYLLLFWQPTKSEINVDKQFCNCITSAP